jgi:plasmid stability protein
MATLTIRDLDDSVRDELRVRAARHGRSMEAEVRAILKAAVTTPPEPGGVGSRIHQRFTELGGLDVETVERVDAPRAPELDG